MHDVPSFLGTGNRGTDQGESNGSITPSFKPSLINSFIDSCSGGVKGQPNHLIGFASLVSISWTHFQSGRKPTLSLKMEGTASLTIFFSFSPKDTSLVCLLATIRIPSHAVSVQCRLNVRGPICFGRRCQASFISIFVMPVHSFAGIGLT